MLACDGTPSNKVMSFMKSGMSEDEQKPAQEEGHQLVMGGDSNKTLTNRRDNVLGNRTCNICKEFLSSRPILSSHHRFRLAQHTSQIR